MVKSLFRLDVVTKFEAVKFMIVPNYLMIGRPPLQSMIKHDVLQYRYGIVLFATIRCAFKIWPTSQKNLTIYR